MAIGRRSGVLVGRVVADGIRWIKTASRRRIDGEGNAKENLVNLRIKNKHRRPQRAYQEVQSSVQEAPVESVQHDMSNKTKLQETPVRLTEICPDFGSTPVGKVLFGIGFEGLAFDRFAERNPRAFQLKEKEAMDWIHNVRQMLRLSEDDLRTLLDRVPKLFTSPVSHIETTVELMKQRFKVEDEQELRQILMGNPFVFDPSFDKMSARAVSLLYERFKITIPDLRKMVMTYPMFLTRMEEGTLLRVAALFDTVMRMSPMQVGRMLKDCPHLLSQTVYGLHERVLFMFNYNLPKLKIQELLMECPALLNTRSTADLRHVATYLEAALNADTSVVAKIITRQPNVLIMDTETEIAPNLAALKNMGFSRHETALIIVRCPKLLSLSLHSAETKWKLQFLAEELEKDVKSLLTYPHYLTYSMTKRLLPRVAYLQTMFNTSYKAWPLMKLFGNSDREFCLRHVRSLPDSFIEFQKEWKTSKDRYVKALINKWAPELRTPRSQL